MKALSFILVLAALLLVGCTKEPEPKPETKPDSTAGYGPACVFDGRWVNEHYAVCLNHGKMSIYALDSHYPSGQPKSTGCALQEYYTAEPTKPGHICSLFCKNDGSGKEYQLTMDRTNYVASVRLYPPDKLLFNYGGTLTMQTFTRETK